MKTILAILILASLATAAQGATGFFNRARYGPLRPEAVVLSKGIAELCLSRGEEYFRVPVAQKRRQKLRNLQIGDVIRLALADGLAQNWTRTGRAEIFRVPELDADCQPVTNLSPSAARVGAPEGIFGLGAAGPLSFLEPMIQRAFECLAGERRGDSRALSCATIASQLRLLVTVENSIADASAGRGHHGRELESAILIMKTLSEEYECR